MKLFMVTICFCVALSELVHAADRKIAYDRVGKIFVANVDGYALKKNRRGRLARNFAGWDTRRV